MFVCVFGGGGRKQTQYNTLATMKNKSMIDRCVLIWNSALTEVLECQTHAKSQKTGLLHFGAMFSALSEVLLHSKPTENPSAVSLTELKVFSEGPEIGSRRTRRNKDNWGQSALIANDCLFVEFTKSAK